MIRVVNKRVCADGEYIGRPSPLGNPFTHLKGRTAAEVEVPTRDAAVDRFAAYLEEKLKSDNPVSREFWRLVKLAEEGPLTLVCWCAPARCHGDVIKMRILKAMLANDLAKAGSPY